MITASYHYGFRIVGDCTKSRRLIDWPAAFSAYSECDERAECDQESYLSAFTFDKDFRDYMSANGTTKGFNGPCRTPWLPFDIDRQGIDDALHDTRKLAAAIVALLGIDESDLLIFFSGGKGFHIQIPTCLWNPPPGAMFHRIAKRFAEGIAERAGIMIDSGIYDRVRLFRAPNSRHPRTGKHKRHLQFRELMAMTPEAIIALAEAPEPFDLPVPTYTLDRAVTLWAEAADAVLQAAEAKAQRYTAGNGTETLNRNTIAFIRNGADTGDRHRLLFSAAANLGEFGCPVALAHALLTEAGLDSGLPPSEVRRQIDCGLSATVGGAA